MNHPYVWPLFLRILPFLFSSPSLFFISQHPLALTSRLATSRFCLRGRCEGGGPCMRQGCVFTDVTTRRIWAYSGRALDPCGAGFKGVRQDRGTSFCSAELRPELIFDLKGRSSLSLSHPPSVSHFILPSLPLFLPSSLSQGVLARTTGTKKSLLLQ